MKYNIKITDHARKRAFERMRMDFSQLKYNANKSLDHGIDIFQDEMLRDLGLKKLRNHNPSGMYLLEGNIYVFVDDVLVTVYPLTYLSFTQEEHL